MEDTLKQLEIKLAESKQLKEENLEKIKQMEREAAEYDKACDYYSAKVEEAAARAQQRLTPVSIPSKVLMMQDKTNKLEAEN
ncbi:hypothetical protein WJX82_006294 [Trebouxia sp. C0006]